MLPRRRRENQSPRRAKAVAVTITTDRRRPLAPPAPPASRRHGGEWRAPRRTYESAFRLAREELAIRTIAFPAISTGVYSFPRREAAGIALDVMREQEAHFERIVACLFDAESARVYEELLAAG